MTDTSRHVDKRLRISILLNLLITGMEVAGAAISGSLSLLSDALHNLSDAFSLAISFVALKLSRKKNTEQRTYGYKRAEILAALLNSSILVIVSFFIFKEAILRLAHPVAINSRVMIAISIFAALANAVSVSLLKEHSHDNINIRSSYVHLLSDVFSSVSIVVGGILLFFFHWRWIDPLLSILVGAFVLMQGFQILNKAIDILMQKVPGQINIFDLQESLEKIPGVKNIHHAHVWQVTDREIHFEAHVNLVRDIHISETDTLKTEIERLLAENYRINHCNLQFEFNSCPDIGLIKG